MERGKGIPKEREVDKRREACESTHDEGGHDEGGHHTSSSRVLESGSPLLSTGSPSGPLLLDRTYYCSQTVFNSVVEE